MFLEYIATYQTHSRGLFLKFQGYRSQHKSRLQLIWISEWHKKHSWSAIHSRNIYWVKKKIWFFDLKNGFLKFLKLFLTHFDIQTWENDTVRLLWRSQKKILRPSIKNRLDTFVPNVLGINLIPFSWSYDQNWLRETLKTEKKAKTPARSTFWNNRLHVLTKNVIFCDILFKNSLKMAKNRRWG